MAEKKDMGDLTGEKSKWGKWEKGRGQRLEQKHAQKESTELSWEAEREMENTEKHNEISKNTN